MASSTTNLGDAVELRFGESPRTSTVAVGAGAVERLPHYWQPRWSGAALIGDSNVIDLHGATLTEKLRSLCARVEVFAFPPGEDHKTRSTKESLEDRMLEAGFDRQCCVVALGGGISVDVAGFVAATFMRGVPHINLPTSLLAQVDASIGGKTGVNTPRGKNLVGAIHQPRAVLVDTDYLETLPPEQWCCGLAEMVKHAVIADAELFSWMEKHAAAISTPPWRAGDNPLRRCVEIKGEIVQRDEREAGVRALLNYGHTLGHALETAMDHSIDHGQAVAVGMLVEGRIALTRCGFAPVDLERLRRLLGLLGLPTRPPKLDFESLIPSLALDKKRRNGQLTLAIPLTIGGMASERGQHTLSCEMALLRRAWDEELRR